MKTFLTKIAQLGSIIDVTLLSSRGEGLFFYSNSRELPAGKDSEARWSEIITSLGNPVTADFVFAKGRYFLQQTTIGYLIVGMQNDSNLNKVRIACNAVSKKLSDTSICKQTLLKLLTDTEELLKPHVIKELLPLADRSVASTLLSLLGQRDQFKANTRDKLLLFICQALGYCKSPEAIEPLQTLLATDKGKLGQNVARAAQIAILQLKESQSQMPTGQSIRGQSRSSQSSHDRPTPSSAASPKNEKTVSTTARNRSSVPNLPEAQQISELLINGSKNEAMTLLLDHISVAAKSRNFIKAEHLRNWLIEIDSMAVGEIIRAAEIIEEERKSAINNEDLNTWQKLIDNISAEAFSALYHAFTRQKFNTGEMIVQQGDLESTLFFINSGKVQIQMTCGGKSEPVSTLEAGTAFGAEAFFELSVWTFGAKSLGAEIFLLSHDVFQKIVGHYPALEAKLADFCRQPLQSQPLFARGRKTRRHHERKTANNRVAFGLLDEKGNEAGRVAKGDLIDISQGGLALSFHASQKKAAANLLGKKVQFSIFCRNTEPLVSRVGIVRAIGSHDPIGNLYSMHVEFDQQLTPTELRRIGVIEKAPS
ncbi:cyclic nucleotide-binding domain-containing protein [Desulfopila aestuarii]|uniref:PilZ domain-containing protein n=1 Tax=Desulfopila aestuarii DSM 18488 TaxID=1121416 RepID=A0A1M7Y8X8_9BACT|nr:cyclic nucleotide-binding domain-containing protein [Desulfopila aestuarii]SHO49080.1 PilZ domain-containing protein [Desulfopila aestuarii DSM 18488]